MEKSWAMSSSSFDRKKSVGVAKQAMASKRYEDVVEEINKVVKKVGVLTVEEISILSDGYEKLTGRHMAYWRMLRSILLEGKSECDKVNEKMEEEETKITSICKHVVSLIDEHLIPFCKLHDHATIVSYFKMKGDYFRYVAEFGKSKYVGDATELSKNAYEVATSIARAQLRPRHPIRLVLALNYAIFYFEIVFSTDRAIEIAKQAYDEAMPAGLNGETNKSSIRLMKLLKDKITLWNPENYSVEFNLW